MSTLRGCHSHMEQNVIVVKIRLFNQNFNNYQKFEVKIDFVACIKEIFEVFYLFCSMLITTMATCAAIIHIKLKCVHVPLPVCMLCLGERLDGFVQLFLRWKGKFRGELNTKIIISTWLTS